MYISGMAGFSRRELRVIALLATFRRKIGVSERPRRVPGFIGDAWGALFGPRSGRSEAPTADHNRAARTFPMLISVSAITPNPTQRFIPSAPR